MNKQEVSSRVGGLDITLETGVMAKQANGSVLVKSGNMVLLCTATMSKKPKEGIDFFPLTIEYLEKMYASGKIPGGFFKRETRPHAKATLTARLIDRPLRPSFPKDFYNDVQVAVTVLSYDKTIPTEALSIIGSSAAITVSDIPFNGPVGAALICEVNGELTASATAEEVENASLEIVVSGTKDAILMIEAGANEVSEERILEAIKMAHEVIKESVALQEDLRAKAGKEKGTVPVIEDDANLKSQISDFIGDKIEQNLQSGEKQEIEDFLSALQDSVLENFVSDDAENEEAVKRLYGKIKKEKIRDVIIRLKVRPDGRAVDEIRPISVDLGVLPSAHGSALFTRGETQSLGVVTLGTSADEQIHDGLDEKSKINYYFHYNFPPYSVGEVGFMTRTGRRELGHGALAERSLQPILPKGDFPYTTRIVSEILESNGSSSMASVCSGSLALMDCGVQTSAAVSGIAMGLLISGDDYVVLSDIQGLEDHYGDMDFKVAGTKDGITSLQLDIKVAGLSEEILRNALEQAKGGRFHILDKMNAAIDSPRTEMSDNAPKIEIIKIDPEKVGLLIGPGGKTIRNIEEQSEATVYVEDGATGEVRIAALNGEIMKKALEMINGLVKDPEIGEEYDGKVVKIVNFGAFVALGSTGKEALLHISKISDKRIERVEDVLSNGEEIKVKIAEIDDTGRISLVRSSK